MLLGTLSNPALPPQHRTHSSQPHGAGSTILASQVVEAGGSRVQSPSRQLSQNPSQEASKEIGSKCLSVKGRNILADTCACLPGWRFLSQSLSSEDHDMTMNTVKN